MYVEKSHTYTYHSLVLVSSTFRKKIHLAVRYNILEITYQTRRDQTYVHQPELCRPKCSPNACFQR